jgi:hypothetical protein
VEVFAQIPWGAIVTLLGMFVGGIVWLVRLEGKTASNKREVEIVDEKVGLTNARVAVTEASITELRATAISRDDLKEVETRVTKAVDDVGDRVASEIDRLVAVISKPAPRARAARSTKSS